MNKKLQTYLQYSAAVQSHVAINTPVFLQFSSFCTRVYLLRACTHRRAIDAWQSHHALLALRTLFRNRAETQFHV